MQVKSSVQRAWDGLRDSSGFSLTEVMVVLVIVGILALLAVPRFTTLTTRAKMAEAQSMLQHVHALQQVYFYEHDVYGSDLEGIGFQQQRLITSGGNARYQLAIDHADQNGFLVRARAVVDFDRDGVFNIWVVDEEGRIRELVPD